MLLLCFLCFAFIVACIALDSWAWSLAQTFKKQHQDIERAHALALLFYLPSRAALTTLVAAKPIIFRHQSPHATAAAMQVGAPRKRIDLILHICIALVSIIYGVALSIQVGVWFAMFILSRDQPNSMYCIAWGVVIMADIVVQCCIILKCVFSLAGRTYMLGVLNTLI